MRYVLFVLLIACIPSQAQQGLKDYYRDYFPIGVAVSPRALMSADTSLILEHFNSLTPENAMKMGPITGVGLQGHWSIFEPGADELRKAIDRFASLGRAGRKRATHSPPICNNARPASTK